MPSKVTAAPSMMDEDQTVTAPQPKRAHTELLSTLDPTEHQSPSVTPSTVAGGKARSTPYASTSTIHRSAPSRPVAIAPRARGASPTRLSTDAESYKQKTVEKQQDAQIQRLQADLAKSNAVAEQSKAVAEQSKAVAEQSKARIEHLEAELYRANQAKVNEATHAEGPHHLITTPSYGPSIGPPMPEPTRNLLGLSPDGDYDGLRWKRDGRATQFIQELVSTPLVSVRDWGDDEELSVHKIDLECAAFDSHKQNGTSLYIHHHGRGCYDAVLQWCTDKPNHHAVVIGNPGIGKSRQLVYLLHRLLHLEDAPHVMIFQQCRDNKIVAFLKENGGYVAYVNVDPIWCAQRCAALMNADNYLLFDPHDVVDKPPCVTAHTVTASSPDDARYKNYVAQTDGAVKFAMPPWNCEELIAAVCDGLGWQSLNNDLRNRHIEADVDSLADVVRKRVSQLGGVPRYVLCDDARFMERKHTLHTQIDDAGNTGHYLLSDVLHINSVTMGAIRGALSRFEPNPIDIPPDPHRYHIMKCLIVPMTSYVTRQLMERRWEDMRALIIGSHPSMSTSIGRVFESFVLNFVKSDVALTLRWRRLQCTGHPFPRSQRVTGNLTFPGGCDIAESLHCWNSALGELIKLDAAHPRGTNHTLSMRVLVPGSPNQPVWDFADAKNRVYQVTTSATHEFPLSELVDVLAVANNIDPTTLPNNLIERLRAINTRRSGHIEPLHMFIIRPETDSAKQMRTAQTVSVPRTVCWGELRDSARSDFLWNNLYAHVHQYVALFRIQDITLHRHT